MTINSMNGRSEKIFKLASFWHIIKKRFTCFFPFLDGLKLWIFCEIEILIKVLKIFSAKYFSNQTFLKRKAVIHKKLTFFQTAQKLLKRDHRK